MTLRASDCLAVVCCAILTCGCAGVSGAPPRQTAAVKRGLDSVISLSRATLRVKPDDAEGHAALGRALLEREMMRQRGYGYLYWGYPSRNSIMLKDIGRPVDSVGVPDNSDAIRESFEHVARAIALNPADARARSTMGRLYMAMGSGWSGDSMYTKATAEFDASIDLDSSSAEAYYDLGCSFLRRNKPAQALAALNRSVSFDSSNGPAYLALGEAFMDTGNFAVAFTCFENAANLGLPSTEEYLRLAGHYTDDSAERRLMGRIASLRKQAPDVLKPVIRAGLRALSLYHPAIALDLASRALEIDSTCAEAHIFRAKVYIDEGDSERASDEFLEACRMGTAPYWSYTGFPKEMRERAYALDPDNDALVFFACGSAINTGDSAGAPALLLQGAKRRPASPLAAYMLGEFYAVHRDTARAIEWYDRVITLPHIAYPSMYRSIEHMYLEAGQIPKAVGAYEGHLKVDWGTWMMDTAAIGNRSKRYGREKLLRSATYCALGYECSWEIHRARPGYWKALAVGLFNRAIETTPLSAAPYNALGTMNMDIGDKVEAIRYYRKAATLGSTYAIESLKRLRMRE
jgi:tetratricopeptide (TPR) repeat protein